MSDISNRLRVLADASGLSYDVAEDACALADRIDTETVELPRDRYGVVIHLATIAARGRGR